jgi:hypothetical protein
MRTAEKAGGIDGDHVHLVAIPHLRKAGPP